MSNTTSEVIGLNSVAGIIGLKAPITGNGPEDTGRCFGVLLIDTGSGLEGSATFWEGAERRGNCVSSLSICSLGENFTEAGTGAVVDLTVVCSGTQSGGLVEMDKGEYGLSGAIVSANVKGEGQVPSGLNEACMLVCSGAGIDEDGCRT